MAGGIAPRQVAFKAVLLVAGCLALVQVSGLAEPVQLLWPAGHGQGTDVIVADFGRDHLRERHPFDGQYIYVTSRLLPDITSITEEIYESDYRLVRILHPLLASPAPAGTPTILLLQVWNLVGVGLLVWALADVFARYGANPEWAMAGAFACAMPIAVTTSEPLAYGLGFAGLCLADRGRTIPAIFLLVLAALTRETAITFAAATALLLWTRAKPFRALTTAVAAAIPLAGWWLYVQSVTEPSRVPLGVLGILKMFDHSSVEIFLSLVSLVLITLSVVAWWDVPPLRWLAICFAAWVPIYEAAGFKLFGIFRLSLPSIALGIAGILRLRQRSRATPSPGSSEARSARAIDAATGS